MTTVDITPFSPPGTPEYAEAGASFQLAVPVDAAGAFTARTIDDVVRAVTAARRSGRRLLLNTTGHADWPSLLAAGPTLTALELRQLGGAFASGAAGGGTLDRFTAPLHYYGVGLAGEETERDLKAVRAALEPSLTGLTAPNFVSHADQPQRSFDDQIRARVERVRRAVDPTGLFAGDVAPTRDQA